MSALFAIVLSLLAIFLILLVLVQRGRGGGLAGALGGMGGSSAFGAKAGDVFTRITVITAAIWIVICLIALFWAEHKGDALGSGASPAASSALDMLPKGTQTPATAEKPASDTAGTIDSKSAPAAAPAGPVVVPAAPPAAETAPATPASPPAEKDAATPAESK